MCIWVWNTNKCVQQHVFKMSLKPLTVSPQNEWVIIIQDLGWTDHCSRLWISDVQLFRPIYLEMKCLEPIVEWFSLVLVPVITCCCLILYTNVVKPNTSKLTYITDTVSKLHSEVIPDHTDPLAGSPKFRKSLAINLFFRVTLNLGFSSGVYNSSVK